MEAKKEILTLINGCIEAALDELYDKDLHLLLYRVHERTIVFRFGHYLQNKLDAHEVFKQYNLDFEYNRNGRQPKRIPTRSRNGAYPDLIIHRRGLNTHNLLIMEFKPYWERNVDDDCDKILQFVDKNGNYKYQFGQSIIFGENRQSVIVKTFIQSHPTTEGGGDYV
jgi:hypothetical protein